MKPGVNRRGVGASPVRSRQAIVVRIIIAAWTMFIISLPHPAAATGDQQAEEAGEFFVAGQAASDAGDQVTAIRAFEESYKTKPHPNTLFALAQAYRRQFLIDHDPARARRALDLYRQYVKEQPKSPWRATADGYVIDLLSTLAREPPPVESATPPPPPATQIMIISRTPGARIFIDGGETGEPSPATRVVDPGDHRIEIKATGYKPEQRTVRAMEGRLIVADVELNRLPGNIQILSSESGSTVFVDGIAAGVTPFSRGQYKPGRHSVVVTSDGYEPWTTNLEVEPERTAAGMADLKWSDQRTVAVITFIGSAALVVGGAVTGLFALQADSSLSSMPTSNNKERAAYDDKLDSRDALAIASTILFSAAAAALLTGAGLYWFDKPDLSAVAASTKPARVPVRPNNGTGEKR
jgi:hypothetical protein